jgi:hypothetical protein
MKIYFCKKITIFWPKKKHIVLLIHDFTLLLNIHILRLKVDKSKSRSKPTLVAYHSYKFL